MNNYVCCWRGKIIEYEHLLLDYLDTFDLSEYLKSLEENPKSDPKFSLFYMTNRDLLGFDFAAQLSGKFKDIGIDSSDYLGMLDGSEQSMRKFVIELCSHLNRRQVLENTGTHVLSRPDVIGDSLLDFMICGVIESINYHSWETPNSLVVLLFSRNNILNGKVIKEFRKTQKQTAAIKAWGRSPEASLSDIAKVTGINKATLSRWLSEDEGFSDKLKYRLNFETDKFMQLMHSILK